MQSRRDRRPDHVVRRWRQTFSLKNSGGSYLSSHDPREVLGLGAAAKLDWVEIKWPAPSTKVHRLTDLALDRYHTVTE